MKISNFLTNTIKVLNITERTLPLAKNISKISKPFINKLFSTKTTKKEENNQQKKKKSNSSLTFFK